MNCLGLILTDYYGCLYLIEYDRETMIKNIIYFIMNIVINPVCYKINQVIALNIAIEIYNDDNKTFTISKNLSSLNLHMKQQHFLTAESLNHTVFSMQHILTSYLETHVRYILYGQQGNTMQCHYNTVNFSTNIHKRHLIAHPLGQGMWCLLWIQHLFVSLSHFLWLIM